MNLTLFTYSFPHKKTYDFLTWLKLSGFEQVSVVAAPRIELGRNQISQPQLFQSLSSEHPDVETRKVCQAYGYAFLEVAHDQTDVIRAFVNQQGSSNLALISGARILSSDVLEIFSEGVINMHPGPIPESSGLDSMYWMIAKGAQPGTTVHFIDARVDAGDLIFFQPCQLDERDTITTLQYKLYQCQLAALEHLLNLLKEGGPLPRKALHRLEKNKPMTFEQKKNTLKAFSYWVSKWTAQQKAS